MAKPKMNENSTIEKDRETSRMNNPTEGGAVAEEGAEIRNEDTGGMEGTFAQSARGIVRNLRDRASNVGGKIHDFADNVDVDGTIGRYPKSFVIVSFFAGALLGASLVGIMRRE